MEKNTVETKKAASTSSAIFEKGTMPLSVTHHDTIPPKGAQVLRSLTRSSTLLRWRLRSSCFSSVVRV